MAWALVSDLIARFGEDELAQLADRGLPRVVTGELLVAGAEGDFSEMSEEEHERVTAALAFLDGKLADAADMAAGYLSSRYPALVNSGEVPDIVKRLVCALARHECYEGRNAPDYVEKSGAAALSTLRDISAGRMSLGETAATEPELGEGIVEITSAGRTFSRGKSGGFI